MRRARGFSALELVVALVIAGILAALAMPYFADREAKATWFQEQVKAAVRYAQRQAVANRRPVYVFLAPAEVKLCFGNPCTASNELVHHRLTAPSGVTISSTTPDFFFNGLGQPSFGSTLAFTVGGNTVTVHAETGYVP
jgi:MSHA pilin protein MshC